MKLMYYKLYLRFIGMPHKKHVELAANVIKSKNPTIHKASVLYAAGFTLDDISDIMGCTRERVRQYLMKAVRMYNNDT